MSFFRFFRRSPPKKTPAPPPPRLREVSDLGSSLPNVTPIDIRRYFHNEHHFQCYTSWFSHWGGWISAGHCLTEAQDHLPDFASMGHVTKWPDGLDAALVGCSLPPTRPTKPIIGRDVMIQGYPAGSRQLEQRKGRI